jgi:hypothetical protein
MELSTAKVLALVRVKVPVVLEIISPLMLVAVATPKTGATKVGVFDRTIFPVPVWLLLAKAVPPPIARVPVTVTFDENDPVVPEMAAADTLPENTPLVTAIGPPV